ncbi:MAG: MmcQ/YjbR family DNA-binding protein [Gaiellaceae bacterium]
MATWADVRDLAAKLPGVEEGTAYRHPALRVAGRWFACMSPHERGALVLHCDPAERPLMTAADEAVYYVTPHYEPHALVLVRLDAIGCEELRERLLDSWLLRAPERLRGAVL